ncbi:MAG: non-canonical purine NTP pyrophosphatase [Candidatus Eremiobacteraeota bacterium]|nr:non-canonical purine NTP pyrophosphatase [Candidatus Eremiobacteraeota bacterium]
MTPEVRPWTQLRLDPGAPIAVATKNRDKLRELIALWGEAKPPLIAAGDSYPEVAEPFDSYEENALVKARTLSSLLEAPALADDSGIEVEWMGWKPGVHSSRTPSAQATWQERNDFILQRLAGAPESARRARFVCVCVLAVPGYAPVMARGESEGIIAAQARGNAGFGYDPIFVYPSYGVTFAEAGEDAKHAVSHRGRALRALRMKVAALVGK